MSGIEEIKGKILNHCKCIRIPNLYGFNYLFPHVREFNRDVFKYHINEGAINIENNSSQITYAKRMVCWVARWEDENINKSCGGINKI